MTIQMRATWNGLEQDSVYTLGSANEEERLVGLGLARRYVRGMDGRGADLQLVVRLGADSLSNALETNAALATGRPVMLTGSGIRQFSRPIILPSNSKLAMDVDCYPQPITNAHFALFRNRDAQNAIPATQITIASGVATFVELGHTRAYGDTYYIEGGLGNTSVNGVMSIIAATPGVSWSIAVASNAALTNDIHQRIMVSSYNPVAGANFTRASGIVTMLDSRPRNPGDHIYITGSISGSSSFKGMFRVLSVNTGVSCTFACPGVNETATGTANVLGDTNIVLDEFQYDGNRANQSGLDQWLDFPFQFVNVGNVRANTRTIRNFWWRGMGFWNAGEIEVPYCSFVNGSVGIQFDSSCAGVRIGKAVGRGMSDDVVAWGVTSQTGPFGETACPSGQGNMGSLMVDEIDGDSPTGLFKHYVTTGFDLGSIRIKRLGGKGPGVSGDNSVGVSGGTCTGLVIESFEAAPSVSGQTGIAAGGCSSYQHFEIARAVDNYSTNSASFLLLVTSTVERLVLPDLVCLSYGAASNPYSPIQVDNGGDVKLLQLLRPVLCVGRGDAVHAAIRVASGGRLRHLALSAPRIFGFGTYNTGSYSGTLLSEAAGGRVDKITLDAPTFPDGQLTSLLYMAGGATTTEIEINGFVQGLADDTPRGRMGSVINDTGSAKSFLITLNGFRVRAIPNNVVQCGGSGAHVIKGQGIDIPAGKIALLTSGTHTTRIDCPEVAIDMGANAGSPPARLSPAAGDRIRNSNATGGGHYIRTAAGAWQLVA